MAIRLRKLVVQPDRRAAARRAVAIAAIDNAYAGRYEAKLGTLLGKRCVEVIGIAPGEAQSYGKLAIVGEAGELEHAAAILHPELGAPLRAAAEKGAARVPSAKKIGTLSTAIDVPLAHKDALRLLRGLFRW
ncbi:amino acid synthesis family protein [Paraburkholderia sp. JPY454]|uniref:Amino acid synthesis family protein n=1 Tax=Paraburkholderia youngii TaxID=2782701 RepID=A0ABX2NX60_9BURK|nr:amino acid synthesis family protein [Paraburkholderia youngii]